MLLGIGLMAGAILSLPARGAVACMGDLNSDRIVRVEEIVEMVACALEDDAGRCAQARVAVDELVRAVNNAMYGCPPEAVWMYIVPCRQCESCALLNIFSIHELVTFLDGGTPDAIPDELLPEEVAILDYQVSSPQIVCSACGCPQSLMPVFHALVSHADVERMTDVGWYVQP